MPVEIKELIIRAVAVEDQARAGSISGSRISDDEREAIIEACVRQVMRILQKSKER
jgi:hypothetical protein